MNRSYIDVESNREHVFKRCELSIYDESFENVPMTYEYIGYYDADGDFVKYLVQQDPVCTMPGCLVAHAPPQPVFFKKDGKNYVAVKFPVYKSDLKTRVFPAFKLVGKKLTTTEVP